MLHSRASLLPLVPLLAACTQQPAPPAQRVDLAQAGGIREPVLPSPVTAAAIWTVAANGHAISFGNRGAPPWLTLDCRLTRARPPQLAIIRHAFARPGQSALFAVMGNGEVARLPAQPVLERGEWRWEAVTPAADPHMDLFIGPGDMRATLPGKGAIAIPPSPVPGQFVEWCRAGGRNAG